MDKKIIWIDDDSEVFKSAKSIFKEYGFNIIKCTSIASGLKQILSQKCNNLLLDIDFPNNEKEGLVFLEQIKIIVPNLKVVIFTGFPNYNDAVRSVKQLFAADYIPKPIPFTKKKRDSFFNKLNEAFGSLELKSKFALNKEHTKSEKIKAFLEDRKIEDFILTVQSIFGGISYNSKTTEGFYHGYFHIILDMTGLKVDSEVETNIGRIDIVIETAKYIYLVEFKLDSSDVALQQIKNKKYFQKYMALGKSIILLGISFDEKERNIHDFRYEDFTK